MATNLAATIRAKYPGAYDDKSDEDLETAWLEKYPGVESYESLANTDSLAKAKVRSMVTGQATEGAIGRKMTAEAEAKQGAGAFLGGAGKGFWEQTVGGILALPGIEFGPKIEALKVLAEPGDAAEKVAAAQRILSPPGTEVVRAMGAGAVEQGKRAADLAMGVERTPEGEIRVKPQAEPGAGAAMLVPFLGPAISEAIQSPTKEKVGHALGSAAGLATMLAAPAKATGALARMRAPRGGTVNIPAGANTAVTAEEVLAALKNAEGAAPRTTPVVPMRVAGAKPRATGGPSGAKARATGGPSVGEAGKAATTALAEMAVHGLGRISHVPSFVSYVVARNVRGLLNRVLGKGKVPTAETIDIPGGMTGTPVGEIPRAPNVRVGAAPETAAEGASVSVGAPPPAVKMGTYPVRASELPKFTADEIATIDSGLKSGFFKNRAQAESLVMEGRAARGGSPPSAEPKAQGRMIVIPKKTEAEPPLRAVEVGGKPRMAPEVQAQIDEALAKAKAKPGMAVSGKAETPVAPAVAAPETPAAPVRVPRKSKVAQAEAEEPSRVVSETTGRPRLPVRPSNLKIEQIPIESRGFKAYGYDPKTKTLELVYTNGETYRYRGVPQEEVTAALAAKSKGKAFGEIADNTEYEVRHQAEAPPPEKGASSAPAPVAEGGTLEGQLKASIEATKPAAIESGKWKGNVRTIKGGGQRYRLTTGEKTVTSTGTTEHHISGTVEPDRITMGTVFAPKQGQAVVQALRDSAKSLGKKDIIFTSKIKPEMAKGEVGVSGEARKWRIRLEKAGEGEQLPDGTFRLFLEKKATAPQAAQIAPGAISTKGGLVASPEPGTAPAAPPAKPGRARGAGPRPTGDLARRGAEIKAQAEAAGTADRTARVGRQTVHAGDVLADGRLVESINDLGIPTLARPLGVAKPSGGLPGKSPSESAKGGQGGAATPSPKAPEAATGPAEVPPGTEVGPDYAAKRARLFRATEQGSADDVASAMTKPERAQFLSELSEGMSEPMARSAIERANRVEPPSRPTRYNVSPNELGFYSQLDRVISDPKTQAKQHGGDWLKFLKDPKRGVKTDELRWSGLDDYLQSKSGNAVTKQDIQNYLDQSRVEIKEIKRGALRPNPEEGRADMETLRKKGFKAEYDEETGQVGFFDLENGDIVDAETLARWAKQDESLWPAAKAAARLEKSISGTETKFSRWQEPGGKNYREVTLTVNTPPTPVARRLSEIGDRLDAITEMPAKEHAAHPELQGEFDRLVAERKKLRAEAPAKKEFTGGHYPEPNVAVHFRLNDRVGPNGEKMLFVEEIQSDWAQQGRQKGFGLKRSTQEDVARDLFDKPYDDLTTSERADVAEELAGRLEGTGGAAPVRAAEGDLPPGPFVESTKAWTDLAVKRITRMAAEQGYDKIAWTTGETQATRYDLSRHLDRIDYEPALGGKYELQVFTKGNKTRPAISEDEIGIERIEELVGKEMAGKIQRGEGVPSGGEYRDWKSLKNLDLKVGGEGMKGYYDQIVPQSFERVGKKFGAKVGESTIAGDLRPVTDGGREWRIMDPTTDSYWVNPDTGHVWAGTSKELAVAQIAKAKSARTVHSIDITPEMRASVKAEGFPQFKAGEGGTQPITLESLKQNLPKSLAKAVTENRPGEFHMETPRGRLIVKATGEIQADYAALEAGHGPETATAVKAGARKIIGATDTVGKDVVVRAVESGVIPHEVGHVFLDHFAKVKERGLIEKRLGPIAKREGRSVDEVFADGFSEWFKGRKVGEAPKSAIHAVYQRIYEFLAGVYSSYFPSVKGIYEDVATGKAFERPTTGKARQNVKPAGRPRVENR